ncbi:MAG: CsgG/HfaB family protein [bacterium]
MKKITVGILVLFFLLASSLIIRSEPVSAETRIAVLTFDGGNINWTRYSFRRERILESITEQITNELVGTEGLNVIERTRVEEVLTEQDFGASGRVDNYSAAEIGRILGVEALVLGTVNRMEISDKGGIKVGPVSLSGVQVDVEYTGRMVDAETAEILMSFKGVGKETDTGLSVSQLHGVSLGTSAFSNSALGKSINAANKDFVNNIIENMPDLSEAREAVKVIEGRVLELVGNRLVIDIGRSSNLKKGQRGSLIQIIDVSGLDEPMTVPIGEVAVYHLEENAAILDVLNSEEPPKPGFIVRF